MILQKYVRYLYLLILIGLLFVMGLGWHWRAQRLERNASDRPQLMPYALDGLDRSDGTYRLRTANVRSTQLPIRLATFMVRWNELARGMEPEYVIFNPSETKMQGESQPRTIPFLFRDGAQLTLTTNAQNNIQLVRFVSHTQAEGQRYRMLSAWSMLLAMADPTLSAENVQTYLYDLGARANADLTRVNRQSFQRNGWTFAVQKTANQIEWTAQVPHIQGVLP